ncbi:DNA-protecting protein DprA [Candidatus Poribacteria bacterium]|nr:MAG: DNA-protecting protein DprA [Candidatus Poribacteria bacterium]
MTPSPEHAALIHLSLMPGVGPAVIRRLVESFGSAEKALKAAEEELRGVLPKGIAERVIEGRRSKSVLNLLERELRSLERTDCRLIAYGEEGYPENLMNIYDPPPLLYIKGELKEEDGFAVAVVGTRRATPYGREACQRIVEQLVEHGFTVVSGLARGIDSIAHRTALKCGGRTIAVLGSGFNHIYPRENAGLAEEIAEKGALITEFPTITPPMDLNFPRRNRIISGLSLATVVVEAGERSGALITANFALEQGREVLAVPGSIFSPASKGTHKLIKEGAALMEDIDDLLCALNLKAEGEEKTRKAEEEELPELDEEERRVLEAVFYTPTHIDDIIAQTGMPANKVSSLLLMLELKGLVAQQPGKTFVRRSGRAIG